MPTVQQLEPQVAAMQAALKGSASQASLVAPTAQRMGRSLSASGLLVQEPHPSHHHRPAPQVLARVGTSGIAIKQATASAPTPFVAGAPLEGGLQAGWQALARTASRSGAAAGGGARKTFGETRGGAWKAGAGVMFPTR